MNTGKFTPNTYSDLKESYDVSIVEALEHRRARDMLMKRIDQLEEEREKLAGKEKASFTRRTGLNQMKKKLEARNAWADGKTLPPVSGWYTEDEHVSRIQENFKELEADIEKLEAKLADWKHTVGNVTWYIDRVAELELARTVHYVMTRFWLNTDTIEEFDARVREWSEEERRRLIRQSFSSNISQVVGQLAYNELAGRFFDNFFGGVDQWLLKSYRWDALVINNIIRDLEPDTIAIEKLDANGL